MVGDPRGGDFLRKGDVHKVSIIDFSFIQMCYSASFFNLSQESILIYLNVLNYKLVNSTL